MNPILLIPGISNSAPLHWQSLWEEKHPNVSRIMQDNWERPVCYEWVEKIERAVQSCTHPPVLVAHSLGCLAFVHWLSASRLGITGAMLVAIPNPDGSIFPKAAVGFTQIPESARRASILAVGSTDDPYADTHFTEQITQRLEAKYISIGAKGHINAQSEIGDWPQGWLLLKQHFDKPNSSTT